MQIRNYCQGDAAIINWTINLALDWGVSYSRMPLVENGIS